MNWFRAGLTVWSALAFAFSAGAMAGYGSELAEYGYRGAAVFLFWFHAGCAAVHGAVLGWAVLWPEREPESD
jgi:hypothetical protein